MNKRQFHVLVVVSVVLMGGILGCQRETPADKARSPQPASIVDQAAQQAVDAIKTPMDRARGMEGALDKAAERTAEEINKATQ